MKWFIIVSQICLVRCLEQQQFLKALDKGYLNRQKFIDDYVNKRVLHIGVGNSYLANEFKESKKIIGLTISQKEIINANKLNINNYEVVLCDKYSIDFKNLFKDYYFDFIIDINLKSYSCCKTSFYYMFNNFCDINKISFDLEYNFK